MARSGLAEREELALLYDVYGGLLSARQRDLVEQHLHLDLSLGEIAENEGVSRQAVHDALRRSRAQLLRFERELGVVRRYERTRRKLGELARELGRLKTMWLEVLLEASEGPGAAREDAGGGEGAAQVPSRRAADAYAALMRAERLVYELLED
ncbi:MAG: DNA-binding protein [Clostridia bacterium]|nr:DNA-binding protein [Clostridia bacterium]